MDFPSLFYGGIINFVRILLYNVILANTLILVEVSILPLYMMIKL